MIKLNLDYSKVLGFLDKSEIDAMQPYVTVAHNAIHEKDRVRKWFFRMGKLASWIW